MAHVLLSGGWFRPMPRARATKRVINNQLELRAAMARADELLARVYHEAREARAQSDVLAILIQRIGNEHDVIKRVVRRIEADIEAARRGES